MPAAQPPAPAGRRRVVSLAIPTLNAGAAFAETLSAVAGQQVTRELEVVVCDSGSSDGSVQRARDFGATVIEIAPHEFSHGRTRNLLMSRTQGEFVAFLTQDSVPADELWLSRLLEGFAEGEDVGMTFGPYHPTPEASPMVARELTDWFGSFSPQGVAVVDRLEPAERDIDARALLGRRGYFTDANGCVSRAAWERVPFRDVPYAEDHVLAHDMLRAGYAKVYLPDAAVVHSHEYSLVARLRRSFDEARALREVYGWIPSADPRSVLRNLRGNVGADWRSGSDGIGLLAASSLHHAARTIGGLLGSREQRLPESLVVRLSLEGRGRPLVPRKGRAD